MNIRQFNKALKSVEVGSSFYVNAINLSVKCIERLRELIKAGVVVPSLEETKRVMKAEFVEDVLTGKVIVPQMTYYKYKEC